MLGGIECCQWGDDREPICAASRGHDDQDTGGRLSRQCLPPSYEQVSSVTVFDYYE